MVVWGGQSGRMQLGVDVRTDGIDANSTAVNVYIDCWVRVINWRYDDNQAVTATGSIGWVGSLGFRNYQARNGTYEFPVWTITLQNQGLSYGGGPDYVFGFQLSGAYDGSAPGVAIGWRLPARPPSPPGPPTITQFTGITGSSVEVQFAGPGNNGGAGVDAYEIRLASNSSMSGYRSSGAISGGPARFSGLARGTTYWAQGFSHNVAGWSGGSGLAAFRTLDVPSAPYNVDVRNLTPTSATIIWSGPDSNGGSPITSMGVYLATDPNFTNTVVAQGDGNITGLIPGTLYYVRVRARNAVDAGPYSAVGSFRTLSGAKIKVAGVWRDHRAWARLNNAAQTMRVYKKVSGVWRN